MNAVEMYLTINLQKFNNYYCKFQDIVKIPRIFKENKNIIDYKKKVKIISLRNKDGRYALKNRRSINKDWKDFNNL